MPLLSDDFGTSLFFDRSDALFLARGCDTDLACGEASGAGAVVVSAM